MCRVRSSARRVRAPDGTEWAVARRWIPRWAAARLRRSVGERVRRTGRKRKGDANDESGRWYDSLDIPLDADGCFDELAIGLAVIVAVVAVWFLVIPLLVLVVDVLIAVALVVAVGLARVLLRRPWVVEARGPNEATIRRLVVGWRESAAEVERLGTDISLGIVRPQGPPTASR